MLVLSIGALPLTGCGGGAADTLPDGRPTYVEILNASYDPTRELYQDFNAAFARHWFTERARR
jgi:sulfate/thiosulfate transport system substrate-binding protein